MPFPFGPADTQDTWSPATTFTGFQAAQRITIRVERVPVFMSLQLGLAGSWGAEEMLAQGWPSLTRPVKFTGVRFRSAISGQPATVSGMVMEQ